MVSFRFQIAHDLIGIVGLLLVSGLIVLVHQVPILLTDHGPLSLTASRLFNAGITIIAILFTNLVIARIRHGFIRSLEARLRDIDVSTIMTVDSYGDPEEHTASRNAALKRLDRRWRGVLGINTILCLILAVDD